MKSKDLKRRTGVELIAQGRLLTITPYGRYGKVANNDGRGEIKEFSKKSRKRLLELIARLENVDRKGYRSNASFLTLTTKHHHHPTSFKVLLFTWLKRLRRKNLRLSAIWRIEPQKRGATHAHLILYNAPWIGKKWIQSTWGEVIEEPSPFTRIERVKSYKHIMSYASKYIAKSGGFNNVPYLTDKETGEIILPGRQWGIFNREGLPFAESTTIVIPLDGSWWVIRRYCQKLWSGLELVSGDGFTIFCDDPEEHLERIVTTSKQFAEAEASYSLQTMPKDKQL